MTNKHSPSVETSTQHDKEADPPVKDTRPEPQSPPQVVSAPPTPVSAHPNEQPQTVIDITHSPPPSHPPLQNGPAQLSQPPPPVHWRQIQTRDASQPSKNVPLAPRPIYPSHPPSQSLPPRPPPYVVHAHPSGPPRPPLLMDRCPRCAYIATLPLEQRQPPGSPPQPPLLMDRCPRCAYIPTLQQGQQQPPLPPRGAYIPSHMLPQPQRPPQQSLQPRPPPPSQPQSQPAPPPPPPQSPTKTSRYIWQVPPEFRTHQFLLHYEGPPPPLGTQRQIPSTYPPQDGDMPPGISDFFPYDSDGYVPKLFIPPPKYAPVPTPEAIASLAPKWPKPPKDSSPKDNSDESRREKQARVGRQRLTRDQRRDVLLMRRLGYQFESIARFLGTTISACHYTCRRGTPETGHKNAGRRVRMPPDMITRMCEYVKDYQKQERAAGKDRKTGKKKIQQLTYNMIRDKVFRDEAGEIPAELKYTDDALKSLLNKYGLWLRNRMTEARKQEGRARGIKQWKDKLAKDRAQAQRQAAAAKAAGQSVSEELTALASGAMVVDEAGSDMDMEGEGYGSPGEDDEMGEAYSGTDDTPSERDEDDDDDGGGGGSIDGDGNERGDESGQPMQIEEQLRQAIAAPENYR